MIGKALGRLMALPATLPVDAARVVLEAADEAIKQVDRSYERAVDRPVERR